MQALYTAVHLIVFHYCCIVSKLLWPKAMLACVSIIIICELRPDKVNT